MTELLGFESPRCERCVKAIVGSKCEDFRAEVVSRCEMCLDLASFSRRAQSEAVFRRQSEAREQYTHTERQK